ncbi:MAG: response regulator [Deltaproteobacteria bacterium]|nr:response regulator [Deltaproteobacteria bacterium]
MRKDIYKFKSLRSRLTFWFLVVFIVPMSAGITAVYFQQTASIRTEATNKLEAVREMKTRRLNEWIEERSGDLRAASRNFQLVKLGEVFRKSEPSAQDIASINNARHELMLFIDSSKNYRELFVINRWTKRTAVSTKRYREGIDRSTAPYFQEPVRTRALYISDIYYSYNERIPVMEFAHPIFCTDHNGEHVTGVLAARIDLQGSLYPMLLDRTGMGKTGETLIVDERGMALNPLRYIENAPFNVRISAEPSRLALKKLTGTLQTKDYRNEPVIAAYTYIPATRWGFVAKQDLAELYKPIRVTVERFAIALLVLIVSVTAFATLLSRAISKPVLQVAEVAQTITEGDHSARCSVRTEDEAASMARSINKMAETLLSRTRINQAVSDIFDTVAVCATAQELALALLGKLLSATGASLGVFYRRGEDRKSLEPVASLGCLKEMSVRFDTTHLEGQLGMVLLAKRPVFVEEISEQTLFRFKTVAGEAVPTHLVSIPILVDNEVAAVIALASFSPFSREQREIIEQILITLSAAFANLLAGEKTRLMADELRSRNEVLASNNEELQKRAEELRKLSAELAEERERVTEADRLKSEFLSNMSHELRTPLNSIMALSQLMMSRGTGKDEKQENEFLRIIERNGRQLLTLINDILDLSKIEAGTVDIQSAEIDLSAVIQSAVLTVKPLADQKGLKLSVNLSDIPHFFSDQNKIRQILINLLSNAVKFTDQGGISVSAASDDGVVSITVKDSGIGIAQADQSDIFKAFRQADGSSTRRHEGTGLGLTISYRLAQLLGGELILQSAPGRGSTFTVRLPLLIKSEMQSALTPIAAEHKAQPEDKAVWSANRRTVLVIDDDPDFRATIKRHLIDAGYAVVVADTGEQGIELAKRLQPFAITLDVYIPEMDGWEILRELKANEQTAAIPVIIVSVSEDRAMGVALGASAYLVKPVNAAVLLAELERLGATKRINRILVVDDDPLAREMLRGVLKDKYPVVDQAEGGRQALAIARSQNPPDVMLLDLMMPDIDGFTVLDSLRLDARTRAMPVIIVTAKDLTARERARLEEASRKIIEKNGLDRELLLREVTSVLARIEGEASRSFESRRAAASEIRKTVLVVEDNPDNLTTINAILEDLNLDVISAENGLAGVETAKKSRPDLILMDIQLPDINGIDAVRRIKSQSELRAIPVVALTAMAMKGDRELMIDSGFDDYLSKPIDPEGVKQTVRKWIETKA